MSVLENAFISESHCSSFAVLPVPGVPSRLTEINDCRYPGVGALGKKDIRRAKVIMGKYNFLGTLNLDVVSLMEGFPSVGAYKGPWVTKRPFITQEDIIQGSLADASY